MSEVIYSEFRKPRQMLGTQESMVTYRYTMTKWPAILVSAVLRLRANPF